MNHHILFGKLVIFVHANSHGAIKSTRGVELISLPLDKGEEEWLKEFLEQGKGRNVEGANDTLIMRAIAIGRSDSVSQDRRTKNSRKIDGVDWDTLRGSMPKS